MFILFESNDGRRNKEGDDDESFENHLCLNFDFIRNNQPAYNQMLEGVHLFRVNQFEKSNKFEA